VARLCASPFTRLASDVTHESNIALNAERGLRKVEVKTYCNILTTLRAATRTAEAAKSTETAAEELLKDVLETAKLAEEILTAKRLSSIVPRPFLRIRENLVGFSHFSETMFGFRVARIRIGMCLSGQLPKRLLDLLLGCVALHSKRLVIIPHAS
jgi:hypothetical protein